MYQNQDALKHMTKDQLDDVLGELQICDLLEDMDLGNAEKENVANVVEEDNQAIDDLILKMEKVTIDKPEGK